MAGVAARSLDFARDPELVERTSRAAGAGRQPSLKLRLGTRLRCENRLSLDSGALSDDLPDLLPGEIEAVQACSRWISARC
jgi:hypothetical protein